MRTRSYFDGNVVLVEHQRKREVGWSTRTAIRVGIMLPGTYDFGRVKRAWHVQVTSGLLTVKGHVGEFMKSNGPATFDKGQKMVITATELTTFRMYNFLGT